MPSSPEPPPPIAIAGNSTRARLIRAALDTAADVGFDATTTSAIVARAEVSRPTLYSYFGDAVGVLADAWVEIGPAWLESLTCGASNAAIRAHPWHRVLIALVLAAPRVLELGEVVSPDVRKVSVTDATTERGLRTIWLLSTEIGVAAGRGIIDGIDDALRILPLVRTLPDDARARLGIDDRPWVVPPIAMSPPTLEPSSDPNTAALIQASIGVIARAGVANASMTRICRAARMTTGASKRRFDSVHEVVLHGFELALEEVVASNIVQTPTLDSGESPWDRVAAFSVAGLDPARDEWRRYRQELYLAAFHDAPVAEMLAGAVRRTDKLLEANWLEIGLTPAQARMCLLANHATTLGFAALHALGVPVGSFDQRTMFRWMADRLLG